MSSNGNEKPFGDQSSSNKLSEKPKTPRHPSIWTRSAVCMQPLREPPDNLRITVEAPSWCALQEFNIKADYKTSTEFLTALVQVQSFWNKLEPHKADNPGPNSSLSLLADREYAIRLPYHLRYQLERLPPPHLPYLPPAGRGQASNQLATRPPGQVADQKRGLPSTLDESATRRLILLDHKQVEYRYNKRQKVDIEDRNLLKALQRGNLGPKLYQRNLPQAAGDRETPVRGLEKPEQRGSSSNVPNHEQDQRALAGHVQRLVLPEKPPHLQHRVW
ncbi:hypothetical protein F4781DRAFT_435063 [Annulohypoxylon bovei var. microspora]|nr:hypothetical protein F4781DRAFT_435063 [Annulohypoxylon bovei var. microspora]